MADINEDELSGISPVIPYLLHEYASNNGSGGVAAGTTYTTGSVTGESLFAAIASTSASGVATTYRVDFPSDHLPGDLFVLEYAPVGSNAFTPVAGSNIDYDENGTNNTTGFFGYGMRAEYNSALPANSYNVIFGNGGIRQNAASGTAGQAWSAIATWKWRLHRIRFVTSTMGTPSSGSGGGITPVTITTSGTIIANRRENVKLSGANITRTLPPLPLVGEQPISGLLLDAGRTASATLKINLAPATGQALGTLPVNEPLSINYAGGWIAYSAAGGDTSWNIETQANTTVSPATSLTEGTVKKNLYQMKICTANVTTQGTNIVSFANLVPGKTYRIFASLTGIRGTAGGSASALVYHGGSLVAAFGVGSQSGGSPVDRMAGLSFQRIFEATGTTISVAADLFGSGSMIVGHATVAYSYGTLEELNNYEATTQW